MDKILEALKKPLPYPITTGVYYGESPLAGAAMTFERLRLASEAMMNSRLFTTATITVIENCHLPELDTDGKPYIGLFVENGKILHVPNLSKWIWSMTMWSFDERLEMVMRHERSKTGRKFDQWWDKEAKHREWQRIMKSTGFLPIDITMDIKYEEQMIARAFGIPASLLQSQP